ncbi:MAG: hypothetical protein AB8I08_29155 [Sandaracinaceae bacterium]
MARWVWALVGLMMMGCGSSGDTPTDDSPRGQGRPATAPPEADPTPAWLETLLEFDLSGPATDRRTISLSRELHSPVVCPQPGTGCYVELTLAGVVTQLHLADDHTIQIWGPTEAMEMPGWVAGVETELEASRLRAVNEEGARPDRLFEDDNHLVLLHDHSEQECGGFCPAMVWIGPPGHSAAAGYGFPARE